MQQAGYTNISNKEPGVYAQDTWKAAQRLPLNDGLRWEPQFFPQMTIAPSAAVYGQYLGDPRFPSNGLLPSQTGMFQPRSGFVFDVLGNGRLSLRGSAGTFKTRQNSLTQVGAITPNGVQQQAPKEFAGLGKPTYAGILPPLNFPVTGCPGAGVKVSDGNYHNPRIYTYHVAFDQQIRGDYVAFLDATLSKGVYLTTFLNPNLGPVTVLPGQAGTSGNADTATSLQVAAEAQCSLNLARLHPFSFAPSRSPVLLGFFFEPDRHGSSARCSDWPACGRGLPEPRKRSALLPARQVQP